MNKTLTGNIGGLVFHIEEKAYEVLRKYLDAIKSHFSVSDGRDEIMQDIESRIAEMLQQHLKDAKQVTTEEDVNSIINVMGRPEQFLDEEDKSNGDEAFAQMYKSKYRRIYRDADDRVLAGVCAGLSHRIGIDPLWLRLIWVFITIATWSGAFWLYIILAIVLPKAQTPAQKIEMRGEEVNIESIKKQWDTPATQQSKTKNSVNNFFELLGDIVLTIFKAFVYVIGIILAIAGIGIFIALFISLLAVLGLAPLMPHGIFDAFVSPSLQLWMALSLFLVIGIPVLLLIYAVVKMVFKTRPVPKWFNFSLLILWIAGVIAMFATVSLAAREYSVVQKKRITVPIVQPSNDTLIVDVGLQNETDRFIRRRLSFFGKRYNYRSGTEELMIPDVGLKILKASGSEFEVEQVQVSHGRNDKEAFQNAAKIDYAINQSGNTIKLDEYFPLQKGGIFRHQRVNILLKVPVGKSVYLSENIKKILNDVDNVTNTWDWDMVNHTWTMTENGLECIGCNLDGEGEDSDSIKQEEGETNADIVIDEKGIVISTERDTIHTKDVKIKIDKSGVNIKSK